MKLNNKGFSLVELLATMVILGIILAAGIAQYRKYTRDATIQSYDVLAESASQAAENYIMDHGNNIDSINLDELVEDGYLENMDDAAVEDGNCTGTVNIINNPGELEGQIDYNDFTVSLCCKNYNYTYAFPGGSKVEDKTGCRANENVRKYIEPNPEVNCLSSTTQNITYSIYTMDYIGKICDKDANNKYGTCSDSVENLPCRKYTYHQRYCTCTYSQNTNKFCSSSVSATGDDHTMKVRYYENTNGISACKSDDSKKINSYVSRVCTYGTYSTGKDVMTFHGYQFFKGASVGYTDFQPNGSWFHDGGYYDDRVPRGADVNGKPNYEDGCRKTCIHFTEKWMGPVE